MDAPDSPCEPPLQQSTAFARALQATGRPFSRLPCGAIVLRRSWGPVAVQMLARADASANRLAALRDASLSGPAILSPDRPPARDLPLVPLVSPVCFGVLSLRTSEAGLRAALHQKWRNRLRHAERHPLKVTRSNLPPRPDHWLLRAEADRQVARGYRNWPADLTCAYARETPGAAKLFVAHLDGAAVAAVLLLRHGAAATYHIGYTEASGRAASAQTLLMWQAICWLRRKGVKRLDLGTLDTEKGAGLARFKLGTGATPVRLGGTWLWWPPLTRLARPLTALDRRLMEGA